MKPAYWLLFGLPLACGGATAAPTGDDPAGALCAGRAPCAVAARHPAGGRLEVVQLQLGPDPERGCPREEWWRLGDGPPLRLLALCNDGYGASGVGEDSVEVKPGELIHSQYGGSAWRWSTTRRIGLSPHRLLREEQRSFHAAEPAREQTRALDAVEGRWTTEWTAGSCGSGAWLDLPVADRAPPPALPLGSCAARATAAGPHLAHGAPGAAADAALWALLVGETTLIVDLADDTWVKAPAAGGSWLHEDHVELWLSAEEPSATHDWECGPQKDGPGAVQWALRLDGSVIPAHRAAGQPAPAARVVAGGPADRVRLQITLPAAPAGLTVVYSDSDDGRRQERLIATSALRFGDPRSLGAAVTLAAGACGEAGGAWALLPAAPPDAP